MPPVVLIIILVASHFLVAGFRLGQLSHEDSCYENITIRFFSRGLAAMCFFRNIPSYFHHILQITAELDVDSIRNCRFYCKTIKKPVPVSTGYQ